MGNVHAEEEAPGCGDRRSTRPSGCDRQPQRPGVESPEAPLISQDPVADNTDLYLFRDVDEPDEGRHRRQLHRARAAGGGPNFAKFGDDVLYEIHIDNNGDVEDDITYQFRFRTIIEQPNTFLYNTGPIDRDDLREPERPAGVLGPPDQARPVDGARHQRADAAGEHRSRSTPNYAELRRHVDQATARRRQGVRRTARRSVLRRPRFGLRPARPAPAQQRPPHPAADGARGATALAGKNVHSIVLQLPITVGQQERQRADHGRLEGVVHRRLRVGQPPAGASAVRRTAVSPATSASPSRSAGSASRSSTRC